MKRLTATLTLLAVALAPTAALAYVGPGAGLSLLGALWALLAAVGTALLFVIAWPVRSMLRRRRARATGPQEHPKRGDAGVEREKAEH
jgi:membrane protein implicated in regulation of membrane protease activity